MSRRQKQILNFILEDVYELLIACWFFAVLMVQNTQLGTLSLINEVLFHLERVLFVFLLALTAGRAVRDGSYKTVRLYVVLIVGVLSLFSGAERWIFETAVLAVGLRGAERDRILGKLYAVLLAATAIIVLLGAAGIIHGESVIRKNGTVRYSLGFYHPNTLGMRFFQIAAMRMYFRAKKGLRIVDAAASFAMGVFIYVVADSKTSTLLLFLLGAAALLFYFSGKSRFGNAVLMDGVLNSIFKVLAVLPAAIAAFAVFGALELGHLPQAINESTTIWSRFNQSRLYYEYYGLSWHGRALMDRNSAGAPAGMYTLDNGYMYLLLGFGVLAFALLVIGQVCLVLRTYRRKEWMLLIILVLYLLFGLMETSFIRPYCNFFLLLLAEVLWDGSLAKDPLIDGGKS